MIAVVNWVKITTERKTERTDNTEEVKKTYAQQLTGGLLASAVPLSVWQFLLAANLFFKWNFVLLIRTSYCRQTVTYKRLTEMLNLIYSRNSKLNSIWKYWKSKLNLLIETHVDIVNYLEKKGTKLA